MKITSLRFFMIISLSIICAVGVWAVGRPFIRGETMGQSAVCQKWGSQDLKIELFKNSSPEARAPMACSILKNQKSFVGKDILEVRNMLGDFDGYYFSDMYPTYLIQVGKDRSEDSWQLVFLIDRNRKIKQVVVHKNCCDR